MKASAIFLTVMTLFVLDADGGTQERLEASRQKIDSLDQRIVELIQERAQVVEEIGKIKREAHLPVKAAGREKQVIEKAQELAKGGPLPADAVGRIYQNLVKEMRNWEAKLDAASAPQSANQQATTGDSR
jgi:chorismate mutase